MKTWLILIISVLFACNSALASGLVTGGTKHGFVPGDRVLFETNFNQCPVGEVPGGFDEIQGVAECVKYQDHVWVGANGASDLRMYKHLNLGRGDFSVEFSFFTYGKEGSVSLELYRNSPRGWHEESPGKKVQFKYSCNRFLEGHLEQVGKILDMDHANQKRFKVALQVRRGQFRVFFNGKRLAAVPFHLKEGETVSGFGLIRRGGKSYDLLFTGLKVAKYSKKEAKPSPEKLGIKVQETGEGVKLTVPEHVLFDFNKFILKPQAKEALGAIADVIRKTPTSQILVTGYTDNIGSEEYNLRLSLQRAQSVADFLIYCQKIDPGKFRIQGKGEADPITGNNTDAGRARNRRVEIRLIR